MGMLVNTPADNPGQISTHVEELLMPEPGPGEVLVHLTVSLLHPIGIKKGLHLPTLRA